MSAQLDLFAAAPSPARRPTRPDTPLLLAMSDDHARADRPLPASTPPAPATPPINRRDTIRRADRAIAMLTGERAGMGTRKLDDCFEMYDGQEVADLICERLRASPDLARRVRDGKSRVRDWDGEREVWADRYLSAPMKAAIEDALAARIDCGMNAKQGYGDNPPCDDRRCGWCHRANAGETLPPATFKRMCASYSADTIGMKGITRAPCQHAGAQWVAVSLGSGLKEYCKAYRIEPDDGTATPYASHPWDTMREHALGGYHNMAVKVRGEVMRLVGPPRTFTCSTL